MPAKPYLPARESIDSRFPRRIYAPLQEAVDALPRAEGPDQGPIIPNTLTSLDGVEKRAMDGLQAQRQLGPMPKMIVNGVPNFTPPAAEPPKAVLPTPGQLAQTGALATPAPASFPLRGVAPVSPLGGMDPRPLSTRGPLRGPLGVGTNNPNAVRVGPLRAPGERELRTLARRGNAEAAGMLFQAGQQAGTEQRRDAMSMWRDNQEAQRREAEYQRNRADEVTDTAAANGMRLWQMQQEQERRDAERNQGRAWQTEDQKAQWAREDAQRENDSIVGDATIPVQGGTVPAVKTKGGGVRMAGGFIPAPKAAPDMSGITNDPNLRIKSVDSTGKTVFERIDDKGKDPVIEWVKGEGLTAGQVPYQRMIDPQTGEVTFRKVRVIDTDGDGVVSPAEKAAAAAPAAAAAEAPKAPVKKAEAAPTSTASGQTAGGIKFKLKA